ncbi:DUF6428 family protein [Larkinella bovis]|uniref:DUF6428 family protein n=1 Tax=Larkinella bovis TaxID=683041 RepID=A0ABW0I9S0_9BACT
MDTTTKKTEPIDWQTFKRTLLDHPEQHLLFEYAENHWVDAAFHITEIKQAPIVSVDCGGKMNAWTEIIVQLWEPPMPEPGRSMKVSKALSIIDRVEQLLPLHPLATVKIEFGNTRFDARQLYPAEFISEGDTFTIRLTPDFTQCKAQNRDQQCGTGSPKTAPGHPERIGEEIAACTPGAACCG